MKKLSVISFCLCFLIAVSFLFLYFRNPSIYTEVDSYDSCFTFISPIANKGYWGSAAYGMMKEDSIQNTNTKFIGLPQYAAGQMEKAIRSTVYSGTNGIISVGNHSPGIVSALQTASDAQIPIVLIDTDSSDIERICYIGTNNYEAGRLAGKDMSSSVSSPLHVAVILSSAESNNQSERLRGFQDELSLHPDCSVETVIEANSSLLLLHEVLPRILKENPKINAIFCAEGYSSSMVGKILSSMGEKYDTIKIVAFDKMEDTLRYVKSGRYFSTIVQQSDLMGHLAVKILSDYQKGILPKQDIIYTDSFSIRQDNFDTIKKYESEGVIWHLFNGNILQTALNKN